MQGESLLETVQNKQTEKGNMEETETTKGEETFKRE